MQPICQHLIRQWFTDGQKTFLYHRRRPELRPRLDRGSTREEDVEHSCLARHRHGLPRRYWRPAGNLANSDLKPKWYLQCARKCWRRRSSKACSGANLHRQINRKISDLTRAHRPYGWKERSFAQQSDFKDQVRVPCETQWKFTWWPCRTEQISCQNWRKSQVSSLVITDESYSSVRVGT